MNIHKSVYMNTRGRVIHADLSWSSDEVHTIRFSWAQNPGDKGTTWYMDRESLTHALKADEPFEPEGGDFHIVPDKMNNLVRFRLRSVDDNHQEVTATIMSEPGRLIQFIDEIEKSGFSRYKFSSRDNALLRSWGMETEL